MRALRTILAAAIGAAFILLVCRIVPLTPDLSDWGGRQFPRSYLLPLALLAIAGYLGGWVAGRISPITGRLSGMLATILAGVIAVAWDTGAPMLVPLFHHPAYPVFSDHALLALAVLLVGGHLGGLRVERCAMNRLESASKAMEEARRDVPVNPK